MTRASKTLATRTADTLELLTAEIEYARQITARARRNGYHHLMRSSRRIGEQLHAQHGLLSTVATRELVASARALLTVSRGYLHAITEQLDALDRERTATTTERIQAIAVITQRRALENLHAH